MKKEKKQKKEIASLFESHGGTMTTQSLVNEGVSHYHIKKSLDDGIIETIKRGIYKLANVDLDESVEVSSMIPKGVFCMYTSASIHELTTNIPSKYHVAIPKKDKVRLPDYPPVKLYYWSEKQYSLGIEEIEIEGHQLLRYDLEKTVCDFIKFRNKIGFDDAKEVLKTYLNRKDRNIDKLVKYAKALRVHSIVEPYLKILL